MSSHMWTSIVRDLAEGFLHETTKKLILKNKDVLKRRIPEIFCIKHETFAIGNCKCYVSSPFSFQVKCNL